MKRIIKTLRCENGNLFVTSAGQRLPFADFSGRIEIEEHTTLVPILGTVQKGTKRICASFIVCEDVLYTRAFDDTFIPSGKVYDATADVAGNRLTFSGLRFEDSDPIENELIFEITDMELIQKLLTL